MPLTGSANYNGTFDANSTNGSVKGNFSMLWNFSSLSGSFTLADSDGLDDLTHVKVGSIAFTMTQLAYELSEIGQEMRQEKVPDSIILRTPRAVDAMQVILTKD